MKFPIRFRRTDTKYSSDSSSTYQQKIGSEVSTYGTPIYNNADQTFSIGVSGDATKIKDLKVTRFLTRAFASLMAFAGSTPTATADIVELKTVQNASATTDSSTTFYAKTKQWPDITISTSNTYYKVNSSGLATSKVDTTDYNTYVLCAQKYTCENMKSSYCPVISFLQNSSSDTYNDIKQQRKAYSNIYKIETAKDQLIIYFNKKPVADMQFKLKIVGG